VSGPGSPLRFGRGDEGVGVDPPPPNLSAIFAQTPAVGCGVSPVRNTVL
jgi:hypothetical protein